MAKKQKGKTKPVAKYAGQFNHAKVFRDRTKYKRLNRGTLRKKLVPFFVGLVSQAVVIIYS